MLVEIAAPEIDHQIAQAEGTLTQLRANLQQAQANRDLAQVTWDRASKLVRQGWTTEQQGDTDRLTLKARDAAVAVASANITAQEAQLRVLNQQKSYLSVVAPFDGVITQRNIDVGSLVQADAASGTFLFQLMRSDVIRIQLYVPQDDALGVTPGTAAVARVPEMPGREFPGKVTRIADALQPGSRTLLDRDRRAEPRPCAVARAVLPGRTQDSAQGPSLIVPSEAIIFNREGLSVAVVEDGVAHIRKINLVRDLGTSVEVNAGVSNGQQVILSPQVDMTDGRKVAIFGHRRRNRAFSSEVDTGSREENASK